MTVPTGGRSHSRRSGSLTGLARACVAIALATVALCPASPAYGHAQLLSVEPANGSLLKTDPTEVRVTFSEPVGLASGGLRVIDSSGASVDAGDDVLDGSAVIQRLPALPDGWYIVTWGIVSEDGHVVRASSLFGVGEVEAASRPPAAGSDPGVLVVGPSRAAMDLALLVAAGAWIAWWLVRARTARVRWLAVIASAIALGASIIWIGGQWLDGGEGWLATTAALAAVLRLIALVVGLATARRWPVVSAAATILALLTIVGGGHAATTDFGLLLVMVHLVAASAWLGAGPAVLLILIDRSLSEEHALAVVRRFSAFAPIVLVTVGIAGALLALVLTDGFSGGLATPYVLLLAVKVGMVTLAAVIGVLARRRLRGAPTRSTMRRVFVVDAVLLPLIVVASAGLTLLGPREGRGVADRGGGAVASCTIDAEPLTLSLLASPGIAGRNELRLEGIPPSALEVGIDMAHPATSGAVISMTAQPEEDAWVADVVLPLAGTWDATAAVRLDRFTQVRGTCPISLGDGQ